MPRCRRARSLLAALTVGGGVVVLAVLTACAGTVPAARKQAAPAPGLLAEAAPHADAERSRRTVLSFEDDVIDGDLTVPDAVTTEAREPLRGEPMDVPPRSFMDETSAGVVARGWGTNPTVETNARRDSTFAVDTDTGSYTLARAWLTRGALPDADAVRVEEFVNAFDYGYEPPASSAFRLDVEAFPSPTRKGFHVLRIGLQGRVVPASSRKPANLVFVVDTSGSMDAGGRLELVKRALSSLTELLREDDSVAIVAYADSAQVVLPPTSGLEKARIRAALAELATSGGTNAQAGLRLGYRLAAERARPGTTTRVILATDGMANQGATDVQTLLSDVAEEAARGVLLTTVGVGVDHYNDALLEQLADRGDGRYVYVDGDPAARRVFVDELVGTLEIVAKDAKVQVDFDPLGVQRWRLLGYEDRALARKDFADDRKDGGEVGSGHQVTALYEVQLAPGADRFGVVRVRWQEPQGGPKQIEKELAMSAKRRTVMDAQPSSRLALAVATFAEKLRGSPWARGTMYRDVRVLLSGLPTSLRAREDVVELAVLVEEAAILDKRVDAPSGGALAEGSRAP